MGDTKLVSTEGEGRYGGRRYWLDGFLAPLSGRSDFQLGAARLAEGWLIFPAMYVQNCPPLPLL